VLSIVESLPAVTGQESSKANSTKTQENSGGGGNKRPFGDILSSQESSSSKATKQDPSTENSARESGKAEHPSGKELPDTERDLDKKSSEPSSADNLGGDGRGLKKLDEEGDALAIIDSLSMDDEGVSVLVKEVPVTPPSLVDTKNLGGEGRDSKPLLPSILTGRQGETPATLGKVNHAGLDLGSLQPGLPNEGDIVADIKQNLLGKEPSSTESIDRLMNLDIAGLKTSVSQLSPVASNTPMTQITGSELTSGVKLASTNMVMTSSLGEPSWDSEFVGRVNMVIKGGIQEARIQLSPPEMGRLEIKVTTDSDTAKVMFSVDNVAARDAIEQAIPRLRELLEQGGLQLSHAGVSDHSESQQGRSEVAEELNGGNSMLPADEDPDDTVSWQLGLTSSKSTVDYYI
jgi:hypothetical protein